MSGVPVFLVLINPEALESMILSRKREMNQEQAPLFEYLIGRGLTKALIRSSIRHIQTFPKEIC
jgi:hypothetical protein